MNPVRENSEVVIKLTQIDGWIFHQQLIDFGSGSSPRLQKRRSERLTTGFIERFGERWRISNRIFPHDLAMKSSGKISMEVSKPQWLY